MAPTRQVKEEFYIRRLFDDDVPLFVDATRYARQQQPYPLSAKKALKATCGVRTDDEVVAFSLRSYTGKQAEKEVEHVDSVTDGRRTSQNLLPTRMPRRTLHELTAVAHALSVVLGDEVIVERDGEFHVLALTRTGGEGDLALTGRLTETDGGYVRSDATGDAEFELPVSGVRLRVFLRSPVRERILAYGFSGYLTRKPGETETLVRATALALNSLLGLATFRMLSGMDHVRVPPPGAAAGPHRPSERIAFAVPALLFTTEGVPAARGHVTAEIDLDHIDPVTGGLLLHVHGGDGLEWNPAVAGSVGFGDYERVLAETIAAMVHSVLGAETVRDMAYDIMLSDLSPESASALRTAVTDLPGLAADPARAEVRQTQPVR